MFTNDFYEIYVILFFAISDDCIHYDISHELSPSSLQLSLLSPL